MTRLAEAHGVVEDDAMLVAGVVDAMDGADTIKAVEGGMVPIVGGCCTRSLCTWRHRRECRSLPPPSRHLLQQ